MLQNLWGSRKGGTLIMIIATVHVICKYRNPYYGVFWILRDYVSMSMSMFRLFHVDVLPAKSGTW
jgi:hypothetical protein